MSPDIWVFLKGAFVGASIAAPIGPVAIFCIRQTIAYGWFVGTIAGLGTAVADGAFGALAALGANFVAALLENYGTFFYVIGGGFLLYIGQQVFRSEIEKSQKKVTGKRHYFKMFSSVFLLNFASPMTTLLFVGMFATVGIFEHVESGDIIIPLTFGVFVGALAWWVALTGVVACLRSKLNFKIFTAINKISGAAIFIFGLLTMLKGLQ